ncbi:MAG: hemolysin family protein [Burkholderiaceae bacterium]|nr:hemolysin family protein [Burkholderiaceae bacterium]
MPTEVLLLFALILLNGLFAMSEIALVTARRARLQALVEQGDSGAAAALALNDEPTRFLSTIQVGITSIGIMSGIVGEAAFAEPLGHWLVGLGAEPKTAQLGATALVVVVVTYFSIVLGELVPKRLGQISAEAVARRVARPIAWLAMAAKPFVRLLSASTDVLLDDRQIASLMTPRSEIVYLDLEDDLQANLKHVLDVEHSRFPVCRGGLRDVVGVASARRLLQQVIRGETIDLAKAAEPAVYVPESLTGMELLDNFRSSAGHMALVVDEYGEIQGVVTSQDLFEAIAGEFKPQRTEDAWAVQRADGSWLLDGLIPIPELKDRLNFGAAPEEELGRYNTLSGMVMLLLGRVPATGDVVEWHGWRFEIVDMDKHRIDKVLAAPTPSAATLAEQGILPG